jgi:CheY-like chemotaxis protein
VVVVLVAEDEALIMMNIVDGLTEEGFTVLEARHAEEALSILKVKASGVHILFTDVRMPGEMDGIVLATTRRSIGRGSGFSLHQRTRRLLLMSFLKAAGFCRSHITVRTSLSTSRHSRQPHEALRTGQRL